MRGQEADNDQKHTPQSLQTAYRYVNKSTGSGSHRSQPPTGTEHGHSFRPTHPMSHPLSDTGPCTGRQARLMSAIEVYSTRRHHGCDVPARIGSFSDSTDGNGDRFLTGYNDSMIGYEKIRV